MSTGVGGKAAKKAAHKGSSHVAMGTPATSTIPPPPPTGPAMSPFPFVAKATGSKNPKGKLKIAKKKTITDGCSSSVEMPGNQPSQPAVPPHDVVTLKVNSTATNTTGSSKVKAAKKGVAAVTDGKAMNVTTQGAKMAQSNGVYTDGIDGGQYSDEWEKLAAELLTLGDPVSVATGEVVDERVDIELPGLIPVALTRIYISSFNREVTPLGRGGWTHNYHQWIEPAAGGELVLHDANGRNVAFPDVWSGRGFADVSSGRGFADVSSGRGFADVSSGRGFADVERGASAFHRTKRLRLTSLGDGGYAVYSLDTHLTRTYAPAPAGARPGRSGRSVLRAIEDAWGNRVTLDYDGERLIRIVDTAGREIRFVHDTRGRILLVEVRAGGESGEAVLQTVTYGYTDEGDLSGAVDALGHGESYAYDAHHRVIEKTLGDGVCVHYAYDPASGRCRRTWVDGGAHNVEFIYDLRARTTTTVGNPEPRRFTWSAKGAILKEETFDGEHVREMTYDDDLKLLSEKNAAGEERTFVYDDLGGCVQMTDAAGNVTEWRHEEERHVATIEPGGLTTSFEYDPRGATSAIVLPTGARYDLAYDGQGRLIAAFCADGVVTRAEYDAHHNVVKTTDALGASTTRAYDALGRVIAETDPLGHTTRHEYDAIGQPIRIVHPDGTATEIAYDARGNMVRYTDPLGQSTTMEFAGVRALVRLTDPLGRAWEFSYDKNQRLRAIKNPRAETFEYRYDRAGRVIEETTFDGRTLRYRYSKADNLARIEYPDGTFRELEYDPLGNVVADASPHGTLIYERDPTGRLLRATVDEVTGPVVAEVVWDDLGRVIADVQGGEAVRYEHDIYYRRTARVLPDGQTTRYHYDPVGRLIALDHDGHKVMLQRDANGREVRRYVYRGEVDVESRYDAAGRLTDRWASAPARAGDPARTLLLQRKCTYDALDRVRTIADLRWGTTRLDHDAIGMLTEAQRGPRVELMRYDAADALESLVREIAPAPRPPWRVRQGNLLVRTGEHAYEYDENRRRRRRVGLGERAGEVTEYVWDANDRLREVTLPDGGLLRFTYDAMGRRVRKEVYPPPEEPGVPALEPSRVVRYLWDRETLAVEIDTARGSRAFVIDRRSLAPMLHAEQGAVFTYVNDHVGVPKELLGEDGRVAWSAAHSAWGEVVGAWHDPKAAWERPVETPIRLLGQYADEETGLCFTWFRYFDPAVGRWLSSDPLRTGGGLDLFGFNGSPQIDQDPFGLELTPGGLEHGDVGTMNQLKGASYTGDRFDHHELLNSSWLKNRTTTYDGRYGPNGGQNPAIALDSNRAPGDHQDIGRMQAAAGMTGPNADKTFAQQTARQNMHLNAQFLYKSLRKNGMSAAAAKQKVTELYKKTLEFIKKNKLSC